MAVMVTSAAALFSGVACGQPVSRNVYVRPGVKNWAGNDTGKLHNDDTSVAENVRRSGVTAPASGIAAPAKNPVHVAFTGVVPEMKPVI